MRNETAGSPISLTTSSAPIPEVPHRVADAFSPGSTVILQDGRWRGLLKENGLTFAWFDGARAVATGVRTRVMYGQTLESDADGRALVIGGAGESLFAVDGEGSATSLAALPKDSHATSACWLHDGGVAFVTGSGSLQVHRATEEGLRPVAAVELSLDPWSFRCAPPIADDVYALIGMADFVGVVLAVDLTGTVYELARFPNLSLGDTRLSLDETGERLLLPARDHVNVGGGDLSIVTGLEEAVSRRSDFATRDATVPPVLSPGKAPAAKLAAVDARPAVAPDAAVEPKLAFGPLTTALIRMLRSAPKRSKPAEDILALIRPGMPTDLRAYVHAWATRSPLSPTVYEFWMASPTLVTREWILDLVGSSLQIGIFASGEPILGRLRNTSKSIVMIDEEGVPYEYHGLEGFLSDLQMRAPKDDFALDEWM
ncbi:MAG: hypothetical protein AAGE52_15025 [Myxococcota bacterium]